MIDVGSLSTAARRRALAELDYCDQVLDVLRLDEPDELDRVEYIENLIEERNRARKDREFSRADKIRDELAAMGIILEDGPQGTRWKKKI